MDVDSVTDNMDVDMDILVTWKLEESQNNVDYSVKSLLSLNNMVLLKIMKNLSIYDITKMAETCVRLNNLADEHFKQNYGSISWVNDYEGRKINLSEFKRVWKRFGIHVKTAELSLWDDNEFFELLLILAKYCKNVDSISLNGIHMTSSFLFDVPLIISMFAQLKRFVMIRCFWTLWCPLSFFFRDDSSLEQLSIIKCCCDNRESYQLQLASFCKLKELNVLHCENVFTNFELKECFENNNITSLTLSNVNKINFFDSDLIESLVDTLETLTIDYSNSNFDHLLRLNKLKILRIHCRTLNNIDGQLLKFQANKVLEELELSRIIISKETIQSLENFKSLTSLRFNSCKNTVQDEFFTSLPLIFPQLIQFVYAFSKIKDENILCVTKLMPKLMRLSLFGCNALATETYSKIEKIVINDWHRPKLELIPPKFESLKAFEDIKSLKNGIWLRMDIWHRHFDFSK